MYYVFMADTGVKNELGHDRPPYPPLPLCCTANTPTSPLPATIRLQIINLHA